MKIFFDLLPVIFFFGAYYIAKAFPDGAHALVTNWLAADIPAEQAPILIATFIAIVSTVLQIAIVWLKHRKVDRMLWISLIIITILGGATLAFHNPAFIKFKPTVLYWLFGIVLLVSDVVFRRNLIRRMLEGQIRLLDSVWQRLNLAWALFFVILGALNLYVAYSFSEEVWVNFKLFGCMALIFVFALAQGLYLSKHLLEDNTEH
ncbi:MAG: septation protein A [Betaproteobacteria bacterium]|jgi:intracellular septation protein|nr:septation protein A [Betaproteobacteria bacterium]